MPETNRRDFLRWLAASPLLAGLDLKSCAKPAGPAPPTAPTSATSATSATPPLVTSAEQALDVFDMKAVAQHKLPPAHWGYLSTGVDGEATLRANEEAYARLYLRPRLMVDVRKLDTSVTLFGRSWPTPIFMCPVSGQLAYHP